MIKGTWCFGTKGVFLTENGEKSFNDTANEAMFYEHKTTYSFKPKKKIKEYVVIKCDVRCPATKDIFSALVKENSDKHIELMQRFPNAWKNFVDKGGGFGKKEVKETENLASEKKEPENKDISSKAEEIELLKKEYEDLEDKRSNRGREIRAILKDLEG